MLADCRTRRNSPLSTTVINPERTDICYSTLSLYTLHHATDSSPVLGSLWTLDYTASFTPVPTATR